MERGSKGICLCAESYWKVYSFRPDSKVQVGIRLGFLTAIFFVLMPRIHSLLHDRFLRECVINFSLALLNEPNSSSAGAQLDFWLVQARLKNI